MWLRRHGCRSNRGRATGPCVQPGRTAIDVNRHYASNEVKNQKFNQLLVICVALVGCQEQSPIARSSDGDVGAEDADTDVMGPDSCDVRQVHGASIGGDYLLGALNRERVPSDEFIEFGVVTKTTNNSIEFTLDDHGTHMVTSFPDIEPETDLPAVGSRIKVTFACSVQGTWCNDAEAYVSIRNTAGRLLLQAGEVYELERLDQQYQDEFLLRYDETHVTASCESHTVSVDGSPCSLVAAPSYISLTGQDVRVGHGEGQAVTIDGAPFYLGVVHAYHIEEETCPSTDVMPQYAVGFLVALKP